MKSILVTGGFGFLGTHLIELLLSAGDCQVHVVDNMSTSPLALEDTLQELGQSRGLTYSITTVDEFCKTWNGKQFDEIFHLASVVGPAGVLPHSGRISASIVNDTMAIADIALRHGARLVDVSTSEVYGGGQEGLCSETMAKIVPPKASARLEYAVGKLAAEVALINLSESKGLNGCIVRPFNVTGPRQSGRGGFVLPRFIGQAIAGEDITVFGDGRQIRAFTHVKDMVAGIAAAMSNGQRGEVYNVGNPANICTILELAEEVRKFTGSNSQIVFVDPRSIYGPFYEEANNKYPDATKAIKTLRWQPQYDRSVVVKDTYHYMRSLPANLLARLRGQSADDRGSSVVATATGDSPLARQG